MFAPLTVQLVAPARGLGRAGIAYVGTTHQIRIGEQRIPLDLDDSMLLNLRGPPGTFKQISAVDIVEGRVTTSALADRIVIVGVDHLGLDTTRTSFGPGVSGLEIQATAVHNLVHGDPLTRASFRLDALATLIVGLLVAFLFWPRLALPVWLQTSGVLALLTAYVIASQQVFVAQRVWLAAVAPVLSGGSPGSSHWASATPAKGSSVVGCGTRSLTICQMDSSHSCSKIRAH